MCVLKYSAPCAFASVFVADAPVFPPPSFPSNYCASATLTPLYLQCTGQACSHLDLPVSWFTAWKVFQYLLVWFFFFFMCVWLDLEYSDISIKCTFIERLSLTFQIKIPPKSLCTSFFFTSSMHSTCLHLSQLCVLFVKTRTVCLASWCL